MPISLTVSADCKTLDVIGGPANAEYMLFHNNFLTPTSIYELENPNQPYNGNNNPQTGNPINGYLPLNAEQFQRAYEKYAKAKSMCSTDECNCNC